MATKQAKGELEGPLRSFPDSAKWLGVSLNHLRREVELGNIRAVWVGRRKMIPASELDRFINSNVADVNSGKAVAS